MLFDQVGVVLHYPGNQVFGALAAGLRLCPELKVFDAVVVSTAVDVMDVLEWLQCTTVVLFPYHTMLKMSSTVLPADHVPLMLALPAHFFNRCNFFCVRNWGIHHSVVFLAAQMKGA